MKPIEPIKEPLTTFFDAESRQCICWRLPSYKDGWVIRGLGKIETLAPNTDPIAVFSQEDVARISEPSLAFPIFLCVGIALVSNWIGGDW